ncbi:MAG: TM1802 family CRISPR-associated protein [Candidatus Stygibacter australis]|nr:TM1802 family CRISPR-associated protein [Candidatus Stygibacter australis]
MINSFRLLGHSVLEKAGYYNMSIEADKRKLLLDNLSKVPRAKTDKNEKALLGGRAICLNFDLEKGVFEFRLSEIELSRDHRESIFAFGLANPGDSKKFLMTNNLGTFISATFQGSIEYIKDKKSKKKSSKWFENNISNEYLLLLAKIFDEFYQNEEGISLDENKLEPAQRKVFGEIFGSEQSKCKPGKNPNTEDIYYRLLNKIFYNRESKSLDKFSSIYIVTFNGETILEYENGKYAADYINLCYYDLVKRFSIERGKGQKYCHICQSEKEIIQDIPLLMKFYGTTNPLNFENVSNTNAYKSFSICEDCLIEVLTGMKTVESDLRDYLFDMTVYLIPKDVGDNIDISLYKKIIEILKTTKRNYKDDINKLKAILKASNKKKLTFDIMFYYHPLGSQQFDILRLISNVELLSLLDKLAKFDSISEKYDLDLLEHKTGNNSLTLEDMRNYLFPSWYSEPKNPDYKVLGRKLVEFLDRFLCDRKSSYNELISNFVAIYKKRMHRDKMDNLSPFKMVLGLAVFNEINQIREGEAMKPGNAVTEINQEEYTDFFNTHAEIYGDNYYRQGLFLLGTIISRIKYAQRDKKSNILRKMNLTGMNVRRVPNFFNQVREFAEIYKKDLKYLRQDIWGNITDRLQNIENSGLKNDEVVFYILTGLSYQDYLGIKYGKEKREKGENKTREEEDES